jgi:hypothetical protein
MYILHDIYIEHENLSAQIDFIVIARHCNYFIECKNLYGNITVDKNGNFSRKVNYDKYYKEVGIYNPLTQNQRHLDLVKMIFSSEKTGIMKIAYDKFFSNFHKSIVVLAHPKSTINTDDAPEDIKNKIIRADNLISYIKNIENTINEYPSTDNQLKEVAESFIRISSENSKEYTNKFQSPQAIESKTDNKTEENNKSSNNDIDKDKLYEELKKYRTQKSIEKEIPAYCIFNNAQIKFLIKAMPFDIAELEKVSGFGKVKCSEYGTEIINILNKYRN